MGYLHIENLYKAQDILAFKRCFALEKIHGTSAHVSWKRWLVDQDESAFRVSFSSGGESHDRFKSLFDEANLAKLFAEKFSDEVVIYGEAYGGKQQKMSATYGKELKFVAFDVTVGGLWLAVPQAAEVVEALGLEFVPYEEIEATVEAIDAQRDRDSVQAVRNGISEPRKREGVVLRPPFEVTKNNGARVIAKHKREEFAERVTQVDVDPAKLKVLEDAQAIATEWVTPVRMEHVIGRLISSRENKEYGVEDTGNIVKLMIEDVTREAVGEIVDTPDVRKAIGKAASSLFIKQLKSAL